METPSVFLVNGHNYEVIKLLGHGKGGYSYLVKYENAYFTLKKIHHEPCEYYKFGDKFECELKAYKILKEIGVLVPSLIETSKEDEIIVKEYIEGETIDYFVKNDMMRHAFIDYMKRVSLHAQSFGFNLDYYPTNFIPKEEGIYYIDYEINEYDEKWNFTNWGIKYWTKSKDFIKDFGQ